MIKFKRNKEKVEVQVEHGVFGSGEYFTLDINQTYEYQAELLRRALQDNLNNHLSEIKKKYYDIGWKQAKAKQKKRESFYGGWEKQS